MRHLTITLPRLRRRGSGEKARRKGGYAITWPQFRFVEREPR